MNIFDYAMQIEKEGEALYLEFAKAAGEKGLYVIFTELAQQENRHNEIFKKMKENQEAAVADIPFLENVKSVFADWKQNKDKINFKVPQADLYRRALEIEQKSVDLYTQEAGKVEDEKQKAMFMKIADEERNHYHVVENIIEFITKPKQWVEHAEFTKIGEEY
ncbi:MAG: ferritin family protein [Candidatus Omnitrophota bacterium]